MKRKWSKAILIFISSFLIVGIAFLKTNKGKIALEPLRNEKAPLLMPRMILLREQQGAYFQLFLQEQQEIDPFPIAFDCYAGPDFQEAVAHNYIDEQFVWLTNNSTVEMIEQLAKYEALWRAEIDQSLVALEDLLYPHEYSLLIQAQDEWGKYVDKCFAFDVSLYKPLSSYEMGGSFTRVLYPAERARKVKERAVALWGYRYTLTMELDFIVENEIATISG